MDLLAVTIELNPQSLWAVAQAVGPIVAIVAALFLAVKHFGTLKGLFAKIPIPGGEALVDDVKADPRVCMMHDWDHFQAELLANGADAERIDKFGADTVWPTIQKVKVGG